MTLSHCHSVTLPQYNTITLLHFHIVTLSHYHTFTLPHNCTLQNSTVCIKLTICHMENFSTGHSDIFSIGTCTKDKYQVWYRVVHPDEKIFLCWQSWNQYFPSHDEKMTNRLFVGDWSWTKTKYQKSCLPVWGSQFDVWFTNFKCGKISHTWM